MSIAQILGDTIRDDAVIVGGLVPSLLYATVDPVWEYGFHTGTNDLDIALDLIILDSERYEVAADRLKRGGFRPDVNDQENVTRQRWRSETGARVDFLMPPVPPDTKGGRLQSLTRDFAAYTMRGLDLALARRRLVALSGLDLEGRRVEREVPVCPPEVFVVLKALAIAGRDKPKDAYDIHYVLLHDPDKPKGLARNLVDVRSHTAVVDAKKSLVRDYQEVDSRGPRDVCKFIGQPANDELAGSALAYVLEFVDALR